MKELIKKLVETTGPSGFEHNIREILRKEVEPYADEIRIDNLGNLIVRKGVKTDSNKRIMISGHMDEIGVMVTHVDENGFVRFAAVGGINPLTCVGSRVRFMNGSVGVISIEFGTFGEFFGIQKPTLDKMYIDMGASSIKDCPVKVGYVAAFDRPFEDLGKRLVSKAMDDRIATAIMAQALKDMKSTVNEVYFVFSTQEEVGLRGATTSAYSVDPEIGFAIDVTPTIDTPKGAFNDVKLGNGPAIKVKDSSLVVDPRVVSWMEKAAVKLDIPHQFEVITAGGTDGGAINLTRGGVPAGCISVPTRYVHTPSEMVDYEDVLNCVKLTVELASQPVNLD
ncbi:MAG: M42 family metallopeptidase [Chloroflexi bacterium]|nr:M42 family metallopeptidase [Chloroflexota bacterium]